MKRALLWVSGASLIAVGVFAFSQVTHLLAHGEVEGESLLSLVVGMDIKLAKEWQERGAFTSDITEGADGREVRLLQSYLTHEKEFLTPDDITGYYGEHTKTAVAKLQAEAGLPPTGMVGEQTRNLLNASFVGTVCPTSTQTRLPYKTVVSRTNAIPTTYIPPDLVVLSGMPMKGTMCLEKNAASALVRMVQAAAQDGIHLMVTSAYRRPEVQQLLVDFWVEVQGDSAYNEVAQPGHSEHQLGTTVDLTGESIGNVSVSKQFDTTPEYRWLQSHAHIYGFALSYSSTTGSTTRDYIFEPWHWRFVGL